MSHLPYEQIGEYEAPGCKGGRTRSRRRRPPAGTRPSESLREARPPLACPRPHSTAPPPSAGTAEKIRVYASGIRHTCCYSKRQSGLDQAQQARNCLQAHSSSYQSFVYKFGKCRRYDAVNFEYLEPRRQLQYLQPPCWCPILHGVACAGKADNLLARAGQTFRAATAGGQGSNSVRAPKVLLHAAIPCTDSSNRGSDVGSCLNWPSRCYRVAILPPHTG